MSKDPPRPRRPLYWRVLRLRHVRPNGWQRVLFVEGSIAVAAVLALAGATSVWVLLALPLAVGVVVKSHDVLAANLEGSGPPDAPPAPRR